MGNPVNPTQEQRHENWERALDLRLRGLSYPKIADELGCGLATAHRWVQEALERSIDEPARDIIKIELKRLDKMLESIEEIAANAEDDDVKLRAHDRILKVQERRAKLLGLDSPVQVEVKTEIHYSLEGVDMAAALEPKPDTKPKQIESAIDAEVVEDEKDAG